MAASASPIGLDAAIGSSVEPFARGRIPVDIHGFSPFLSLPSARQQESMSVDPYHSCAAVSIVSKGNKTSVRSVRAVNINRPFKGCRAMDTKVISLLLAHSRSFAVLNSIASSFPNYIAIIVNCEVGLVIAHSTSLSLVVVLFVKILVGKSTN